MLYSLFPLYRHYYRYFPYIDIRDTFSFISCPAFPYIYSVSPIVKITLFCLYIFLLYFAQTIFSYIYRKYCLFSIISLYRENNTFLYRHCLDVWYFPYIYENIAFLFLIYLALVFLIYISIKDTLFSFVSCPDSLYFAYIYSVFLIFL